MMYFLNLYKFNTSGKWQKEFQEFASPWDGMLVDEQTVEGLTLIFKERARVIVAEMSPNRQRDFYFNVFKRKNEIVITVDQAVAIHAHQVLRVELQDHDLSMRINQYGGLLSFPQ